VTENEEEVASRQSLAPASIRVSRSTKSPLRLSAMRTRCEQELIQPLHRIGLAILNQHSPLPNHLNTEQSRQCTMVSTLRREEDTAARHMIYPGSQVERSHHRMQSPGREQQDEKKKKRGKSKRMCAQRCFVSSNQTRSTTLFMNPTVGFSRAVWWN
jgi:hypothetical protein